MYGDEPSVAAIVKKQLMEILPTLLQNTHQQNTRPKKEKSLRQSYQTILQFRRQLPRII